MNKDLYKLEIDMLKECLAVMKPKGLEVFDLLGTLMRASAFATKLQLWLSKPFLARAAGAGRGVKMPSIHINLHSGAVKAKWNFSTAQWSVPVKMPCPPPLNKMLTNTLLALTEKKISARRVYTQTEKVALKVATLKQYL